MTLTEIMKACEVENELHRDKNDWAHPDYASEHLQVTNDLIEELALHVKQQQLKYEALVRDLTPGEL